MTRLSRAAILGLSAGAAIGTIIPSVARADGDAVRLGGLNVDLFAEGLYGIQAKIFQRNGFDATFVPLTNGGAVVSALAGGSLDLGMADLVSGVSAINAGIPIVLLAGGALYKTTEAVSFIAVVRESPVHEPQDLSGKTIAVPTLVGQTSVAVRAWIAASGLNSDSVRLVELPSSAMFPAMQHGTVDAALLSEPFLAPVRSQVRDVGHPFDQISKEYIFSAWYGTRAWVDADHARAKRMVGAIYETARWANSHQSDTMAVLLDASKLDPTHVAGMVRCTFATSMTPALVQPVLTIAAKYKIVDKVYDAGSLIEHL